MSVINESDQMLLDVLPQRSPVIKLWKKPSGTYETTRDKLN